MSVFRNILAGVICETFERECGKWQSRKPEPKAFQVSFAIGIDHDKEEGYRALDVCIFAAGNYVQVCWRSSWNVIPVEDLDIGDDEECSVKPGKNYIEGASAWTEVANHDSCWREGVERILREHEAKAVAARFAGGTATSGARRVGR